jgi:hypothetical protein
VLARCDLILSLVPSRLSLCFSDISFVCFLVCLAKAGDFGGGDPYAQQGQPTDVFPVFKIKRPDAGAGAVGAYGYSYEAADSGVPASGYGVDMSGQWGENGYPGDGGGGGGGGGDFDPSISNKRRREEGGAEPEGESAPKKLKILLADPAAPAPP